MSWLSSFWKHNRDFLGNALKNVAPAAFLIPGVGPAAAAGLAGVGSALGRGVQRGANLKNILKQGASGAGLAYTGGALTGGQGQSLQALKSLFSGGARAGAGQAAAQGAAEKAAELPVAFTPSSASIAGPGGTSALTFPGAGSGVTGGAALRSSPSALAATAARRGLGGAARAVGSFAKEYPTAAAMGLQGIGQIAQAPGENAYRRSQAAALDLQNQQQAELLEQQKRKQKALAEFWPQIQAQFNQQLQQMGQGSGLGAPNPFWSGQGRY